MSYQYPKTPFVLLQLQKSSCIYLFIREVPQGWTACCHPEGALYFVHDESVSELIINTIWYLIYYFIENVYGCEHM